MRRATLKRLGSILVLVLVMGLVAPATASARRGRFGRQKTAVCHHQKASDTYTLKDLGPIRAWLHLKFHADGRPGEPVPSMEGYSFDESCVPTLDQPPPRPPWLEPDIVTEGTTVTIYDDLGRIQDGDIAFLFQDGAQQVFWTAADLALQPGGQATFVVPNRPAGVYQISVRPAINAEPRFEELVFTIN